MILRESDVDLPSVFMFKVIMFLSELPFLCVLKNCRSPAPISLSSEYRFLVEKCKMFISNVSHF